MNRFVITCCLLTMVPSAVLGQNCPDPAPIVCGETITGNSCDGPYNHLTYPCLSRNWQGPESYFVLDLEHGARVEITLVPPDGFWTEWDPALILLPELAGECYPSVDLGCSDCGVSGRPESLAGTLPAGRYFLVVDGFYFDSCGDFELKVECVECSGCVDQDQDGYASYDPGVCPCGADCNDSDPERNPEAVEVCGDGIDQDCDGGDATCSSREGDLAVACGDAGSRSTDDGGSQLSRYCGSDEDLWGGGEYVLEYTADDQGVVTFTIDNLQGQQLDAFAFAGFGAGGQCNKDACIDRSTLQTGTQQIAFYAERGETYFIAVDGRDGDHGAFDYSVACRQESFTPTDDLTCGGAITGDTYGRDDSLSAYRNIPGHMLGADQAFGFSVGYDAVVTLVLTVDAPGGTPSDLALMLLDDLHPGSAFARSNFTQGESGNPPEVLTFLAQAGVTYYPVVDAAEVGTTGGFTLSAQCVRDCPPGQSDCGGVCLDLNTDEENCGFCGNVCSYDHAAASCQNGECQMGACDPGYGDCDHDDQNGCEADLSTAETCGSCTNACQAGERCEDGSCTSRCHDDDKDGYNDAACGGDDCDDTRVGIRPDAAEVCDDGVDQDCDGLTDCDDPECETDWSCNCPDQDGDGYDEAMCGGDDCDDNDAAVHPGAKEECAEGVDQDCDGLTDCDDPDCAGNWVCNCTDADGDGYGEGSGCLGPDCDDTAPLVHPGATDPCGDGVDQNCDGEDPPCQEESGCACLAAPGSGGAGPVWLLAPPILLLLRRRLRI